MSTMKIDYLVDVDEALPVANRLFRDCDWLMGLLTAHPDLQEDITEVFGEVTWGQTR